MSLPLAIDFVSPLPPVRSGISDYSADLLPILDRYCDLRVMRVVSQPVDDGLMNRWTPANAREAGADGRLPLYQMGNNEYHREIFELAMQQPGIVTLHDVVLHHLLVETTLAKGRLEAYASRLVADHGWIGESAAAARRWGELGQASMFSLAAHRTLLRRQRGILVHSRWAAESLVEEDAEIEVRQIPMGIPLPAEADPAAGLAFRQRLGIAAQTPLIGSMGFQTPIKRTEQVIAALGRPGMEEAHLLIAGEVSPVLDFATVAERAGVSDRMHSVGFLDYAEFEQAIAACDLCVNLRYPTAGETSASLLRVLAVGRPAIVSDYAHSAELPDDVVVKIPLGENEVDELAARVGALLVDRPRLREMSRQARRYIAESHDPTRAVEKMVAACAELAESEPPGDCPATPDPPSSLVWREIAGQLEVEGADLPWPEGQMRQLQFRLRNYGPARWLPTREPVAGVCLDLEWRRTPWSPAIEQQRVALPSPLDPGAGRSLEVSVRRPLGGAMLAVRARVQGSAGGEELGGPRWVGFP
jgi:glycosyltransferase involved in cell wall biosynthesis